MVAMVLVIMYEPLPRPTQSSKTLFVLLIVVPLLDRLPLGPCLLLVPDVQLQEGGLDVCRRRRQKKLPEKSIDGWSRVTLKVLLVPAILCRLAIPGFP